jgi:hypothetical protein
LARLLGRCPRSAAPRPAPASSSSPEARRSKHLAGRAERLQRRPPGRRPPEPSAHHSSRAMSTFPRRSYDPAILLTTAARRPGTASISASSRSRSAEGSRHAGRKFFLRPASLPRATDGAVHDREPHAQGAVSLHRDLDQQFCIEDRDRQHWHATASQPDLGMPGRPTRGLSSEKGEHPDFMPIQAAGCSNSLLSPEG